MEKPLISVIVPIYNVEYYLNKCVSSIVSQTYNNLEIILVDDGSLDNCPKMCDEWHEKDKRIVVIHKENGGLSDARNAGMEIVKGEYVSFVDGDDYIDERYIEVLYCNLVNNGVQVSQVDFFYEQEMSEKCNSIEKVSVISSIEAIRNYYLLLSPRMNISACAKLYSKSVIGDFRFPVGKTHEDQFFTPQVVINSKGIAISNQKLYCYVNRENSIMHIGFSEKRWDNIWAVEQCIEEYRKNNIDLVAPAIHYKKKTIAKFNIWANESGLHREVPKQYIMTPFFARIKYFLYMSREEKIDVLLSPLARLKRTLIINKKIITEKKINK